MGIRDRDNLGQPGPISGVLARVGFSSDFDEGAPARQYFVEYELATRDRSIDRYRCRYRYR